MDTQTGRLAYIAEYLPDGSERIIAKDNYWSPELRAKFDACAQGDNLIQAWYRDAEQVTCMGVIPQRKQYPEDNLRQLLLATYGDTA